MVHRASGPIVPDGLLDERAWDKADKTAGTAPAKTAAATPAPPTATAVVKVTPPAGTKPPGKKKKVDDGF